MLLWSGLLAYWNFRNGNKIKEWVTCTTSSGVMILGKWYRVTRSSIWVEQLWWVGLCLAGGFILNLYMNRSWSSSNEFAFTLRRLIVWFETLGSICILRPPLVTVSKKTLMMGNTNSLAAEFDSPLSPDITSVLDKWCEYGTWSLIAVDFFDPMVETYNFEKIGKPIRTHLKYRHHVLQLWLMRIEVSLWPRVTVSSFGFSDIGHLRRLVNLARRGYRLRH